MARPSKYSETIAEKILSRYGDKLDIQHNVTLDITQALLDATKRMKSIGAGAVIDAPVKQLEEAGPDTILLFHAHLYIR